MDEEIITSYFQHQNWTEKSNKICRKELNFTYWKWEKASAHSVEPKSSVLWEGAVEQWPNEVNKVNESQYPIQMKSIVISHFIPTGLAAKHGVTHQHLIFFRIRHHSPLRRRFALQRHPSFPRHPNTKLPSMNWNGRSKVIRPSYMRVLYIGRFFFERWVKVDGRIEWGEA